MAKKKWNDTSSVFAFLFLDFFSTLVNYEQPLFGKQFIIKANKIGAKNEREREIKKKVQNRVVKQIFKTLGLMLKTNNIFFLQLTAADTWKKLLKDRQAWIRYKLLSFNNVTLKRVLEK